MEGWVEEEVGAVRGGERERARWPLWSLQAFLKEGGCVSQYERGLKGEVMIEGVFLKVVVEGGREGGGGGGGGVVDLGPEGVGGGREGGRVGRVLEGLEVSIQSSRNVLQHLSLVCGEGGREEEEEVRREIEGLRVEAERGLKEKEEALEVLLQQFPSFAWRRNRLLGGGGRRK
jgi:hypothetical protein